MANINQSIVINVPNPEPLDDGILDKIFGSSQAISDAVSNFWTMNLAHKAELGKVSQTQNGYSVEILYKSVMP